MPRALRTHRDSRQLPPNTNPSAATNQRRDDVRRRTTTIAGRSTSPSSSSAARDRTRSTARPNINLMTSTSGPESPDSLRRDNRIQFTTGTGTVTNTKQELAMDQRVRPSPRLAPLPQDATPELKDQFELMKR